MLADQKLLRDGAVDTALLLRHALLLAHGHVVALVDALRCEDLAQGVEDQRLAPVHAEADDLHGQAGAEFVHRQAGQAVGLPEDHAAGVFKAEGAAVFPRGADAAQEKAGVRLLAPLAREHAHGDLRPAVEKAEGEEAAAAVEHLDDLAVHAAVIHPVDLVVKYPKPAAEKLFFLPAPQADLSDRHIASENAPTPERRLFY